MYTYPWYHWITFFYIYCFCGWIFESTYVSLKERHFVNRGFLRLPMLPIYGTGAVMMLWVSLPVQDNLILVYIAGFMAATALEYVTGYVMERLFKMKYWDYSSQRFNFRGYICLSSSIAWGFLTILVVKLIHRPIADFVLNLNPAMEYAMIGMISVLFIADTVKSTQEALELARVLEAMTKLKAETEELQVQLALLKAETAQKAEEFYVETSDKILELKDETRQKVTEFADETRLRVSELREETSARLEYMQDKVSQHTQHTAKLLNDLQQHQNALSDRLRITIENRRNLTHHMSFYRKGLLKGNPTASSRTFSEALKELRIILENTDHSGTD